MDLRRELIGLSEYELVKALDAAIDSNPELAEDDSALEAIPELLRDYPALLKFYTEMTKAEDREHPQGGSDSKAYKVGVAVTLYSIKAAAEKQIFIGLETPRDLK